MSAPTSESRSHAPGASATRSVPARARTTRNARRATWMAARARNAARRGGLIASVGVFAVIGTLCVLVLLPREANRRITAQLDALPAAVDTGPLQQQVAHARSVEELALAAVAAVTTDSIAATGALARSMAADAELALGADSAGSVADPDRSDLVRQLAHARDAPLVESYRALGETHLLRSDTRVRATLDSLEQVNRDREAFAALGGPDARFAALSARLEVLGRRLIRLAEQQLASLPPTRARTDSLGAAPAPVGRYSADSIFRRRSRVPTAAARDSLRAAELALATARTWNADVQRRRDATLATAAVHIPPLAMLAASLVLGLALGYAVAFLVEFRSPTVADVSEVERITQARVIVHRRSHRGTDARKLRGRKRKDGVPRVLDDHGEAYELLHLTLTGLGDGARSVRVASATPLLGATVGINLAAAAARESRATLLIDADARAKLAASLLHAPDHNTRPNDMAPEADVERRVVRIQTGTRHELDLLAAGAWQVTADAAERHALSEQLRRIAEHYDLTVVLASGETASDAMLPTTDVILCAQLGVTPLAWLTRASGHLLANQARLRAVLVWDAPAPVMT